MPISMLGYMCRRKWGWGLLADIISMGGAGEKLTMLKTDISINSSVLS